MNPVPQEHTRSILQCFTGPRFHFGDLREVCTKVSTVKTWHYFLPIPLCIKPHPNPSFPKVSYQSVSSTRLGKLFLSCRAGNEYTVCSETTLCMPNVHQITPDYTRYLYRPKVIGWLFIKLHFPSFCWNPREITLMASIAAMAMLHSP